MKTLLALILAFVFCSGCAVMHGQVAYSGKTSSITERIAVYPQAPHSLGVASGAHVWSYFDAEADKEVDINNASNDVEHYKLWCDYSFPSQIEVDVPAHTTQQVLVTTNGAHMYGALCREE